MYLDFYGLREMRYYLTPDPRFLFLGKGHREAFAHLLYGIQSRSGFIVLTGEDGSGKTTLLRTLFSQLGPDHYRTALIYDPSISSLELLQSINREFGIPIQDSDVRNLGEALNMFLLRENAEGHTVVLVIDEVQNVEPSVLEQIRLISNIETEREKLIQIVLAWQPELLQVLARKEAGSYIGELIGVYDRNTLSAVKNFQTSRGIEPDGIAGSQTLLVLYRSHARFDLPKLAGGGI